MDNDAVHTQSLMRVALGTEAADLVITGARIFNVFTGELLDGLAVAVKHGRIAAISSLPGIGLGDGTKIIDARGRTLIPGFIDSHTHLAWMNTPAEFLSLALSGGVTTIITELLEPCPVAGVKGILELLAAMRCQPIQIFATAPAMVSISRRTLGMRHEDLETLLGQPDILGLGESYWQGVLQDPDMYLPQFASVLASGKTLEGHSAGASEAKLNAYAACGISSCHEPIKANEAIDRLRLGMYVMIREGSVRRDLGAIAAIRGAGVDLRRVILVSDGVSAPDLKTFGYMESIVQKAVDLGFRPEDAIRMATLNPAEHFCLSHRIGAIGPGRRADMILIPDLQTILPQTVISNGVVIAQDGKVLVRPRVHAFSSASKTTIRLPRPLVAGDFAVNAPTGQSVRAVRVLEMVTDLVTREAEARLPVMKGDIRADAGRDVLKIAAIDRAIVPGDRFVGFIKGFGLRTGALALSAAWDAADIIVIGENERDMAAAVNRILALQGGMVVCDGGDILAELALPVFGVISEEPVATVSAGLEAVNRTLHALGVPHPDPVKTAATLTSAAIPFFKICEEGYVRMKDGKTLGVFLDEGPALSSADRAGQPAKKPG